MRNFKIKGMTIPLALIISIAMTFLILGLSKSVRFSAHEAAYIGSRDSVFRIAETGLYDAISHLAASPNSFLNGGAQQGAIITYEEGTFQNFVEMSNAPGVEGGYYIRTVAEMNKNKNDFETTLHSHVKISNAAEYFWAVNGLLILAAGTDAASGKVYAAQLDFRTAPGLTTKVESAEFLTDVDPDCDALPGPCDPRYVSSGTGNDIEIGYPTGGLFAHRPIDLESPIVFPQVLDSDIDRYKDLAYFGTANQHVKCDFQVDPNNNPADEIHIYPPGYETVIHPDDDYPVANHSTNINDHLYYCDSGVTIGHPDKPTIIHGQVIIVSKGSIVIEGDIINSSGPLPDQGSVTVGSSTAHQLVLITPGDVTIGDSFHPVVTPTTAVRVLTINAAIVAPYGRMSATPSLVPDTHDFLSLNFLGSMVLNEIENYPSENFGTVFQGETGGNPARTYSYMTSLKTHPPPYVPAIVEIHYSLEDTKLEGSVF